jgi:hypothetical protein
MSTSHAKHALATVAIVLAATIFAPAVTDLHAQTVTCPGNCNVQVTVTGEPPGPVVVAAKDVRMPKGKRNVTITWKLVNAPAFEFRADSIRPHAGAPTGGKQTTTAAAWSDQITFVSNTAVQYHVRNKNSVTTALYYDIVVYHKASGTPYPLDPVIFNDF